MRTIDIGPDPSRARERRSGLFAALAAFALFTLVGWRMSTAIHPSALFQSSVSPTSYADPAADLAADPIGDRAEPARAVPRTSDLQADEVAQIDLFRRSSPGVVHVANVAVYEQRRRDPVEITQGTGTGFVWDEEGHIVTNFHVINESDRVKVSFAGDDRAYDADVVGTAPQHDVAVLRLVDMPRGGLHPLAIGTSTDLQVGQRVYAIGNPFGLDQTLTTGIISGLRREIRSLNNHKISNVIQTDAAINPGNSGGPLLDSSGRLIGITTAIVSPSGAYAGIGFAVPVDVIRKAVPELISRGHVARPGLGVEIIDANNAQRLGLTGVGIGKVRAGSAAERAGLRGAQQTRTGDYVVDEVLAVDDTEINSIENFLDVLDTHAVGDVVTLSVRRQGEVRDVRVKLQSID